MPSWYMSRFSNYMPDLKGKIYIRPLPVFEEGQPRTVGIKQLVISNVMYQVLVERSATPAEALKAAADELRAMEED